jgi:hypothetical protein
LTEHIDNDDIEYVACAILPLRTGTRMKLLPHLLIDTKTTHLIGDGQAHFRHTFNGWRHQVYLACFARTEIHFNGLPCPCFVFHGNFDPDSVCQFNRIALVEEFIPSEPEQKLYNLVSDYLQRRNLYALPASQRQLMTLILRRLLASSTFAIAGTLKGLADKLEKAADAQKPVVEPPQEVAETFESFEELEDEWEGDDDEDETDKKADLRVLSPDQLEKVAEEIKSLRLFTDLANSIAKL